MDFVRVKMYTKQISNRLKVSQQRSQVEGRSEKMQQKSVNATTKSKGDYGARLGRTCTDESVEEYQLIIVIIYQKSLVV